MPAGHIGLAFDIPHTHTVGTGCARCATARRCAARARTASTSRSISRATTARGTGTATWASCKSSRAATARCESASRETESCDTVYFTPPSHTAHSYELAASVKTWHTYRDRLSKIRPRCKEEKYENDSPHSVSARATPPQPAPGAPAVRGPAPSPHYPDQRPAALASRPPPFLK